MAKRCYTYPGFLKTYTIHQAKMATTGKKSSILPTVTVQSFPKHGNHIYILDVIVRINKRGYLGLSKFRKPLKFGQAFLCP
jgi:hypothetical protein